MKKSIITFVFLFSSVFVFSQVAITVNNAKKQNVLPGIDSIYKSAIQVDSTKSVFTGKAKNTFTKAYIQMLQDFEDYLYKNNFRWGKQTQYFNRVYFNTTGGIDHYLYSFKPGTIDASKEKDFNKLANGFFKDYKIPVKTSVKYAQCCPVIISDKKNK